MFIHISNPPSLRQTRGGWTWHLNERPSDELAAGKTDLRVDVPEGHFHSRADLQAGGVLSLQNRHVEKVTLLWKFQEDDNPWRVEALHHGVMHNRPVHNLGPPRYGRELERWVFELAAALAEQHWRMRIRQTMLAALESHSM